MVTTEMSDTTPRTDAVFYSNIEPLEKHHFARELERELNAWRKCAEQLAVVVRPDWINDQEMPDADVRTALADFERLKGWR